jgi:hypothetical protein
MKREMSPRARKQVAVTHTADGLRLREIRDGLK